MILPFSCFNWLKYVRYDSQKQLIKVKQNENYQKKKTCITLITQVPSRTTSWVLLLKHTKKNTKNKTNDYKNMWIKQTTFLLF